MSKRQLSPHSGLAAPAQLATAANDRKLDRLLKTFKVGFGPETSVISAYSLSNAIGSFEPNPDLLALHNG